VRPPRPLLLPVAATAFAVALGGCAGKSRPQLTETERRAVARAEAVEVTDPDAMRVDMRALLRSIDARAIAATSDVAYATKDRAVRERALQWRRLSRNAIDSILLETDPRLMFLRLWVAVTQARQGIEPGGRNATAFGDQQDRMRRLIAAFEEDVLEAGMRYLPDGAIDAARDDIEQLARHATSSVPFSNDLDPSEAGTDISKILTLPLAPFTGLQGIGSTPDALIQAAAVAAGLGTVIQHLPERVRWEAEMLLLDASDLPVVVELMQQIDALRGDVDALTGLAERWPDDVERVLGSTSDRLAAVLPELRATVASAETLVVDLERQPPLWTQTVAELRGLVTDLDAAARGLGLDEAIRRANAAPPAPAAAAPAATAPTVADQLADVRATAADLRAVVADVRAIAAAPDPLAGVRRDAEGLVTHVAVCVAAVVVVFFAALLAYRRLRPKG